MTQVKLVEEHYDRHIKTYECWSGEKGGGYHFGLAKNLSEILDNEKMTQNLSNLVIDNLELDYQSPQVILDAGCGSGHLGRMLARKINHPDSRIYGITLSKKQLVLGNQINKKEGLNKNPRLSLGDFEQTAFADNFFDAVFFVDSICHGDGKNKAKALKEAFRILKPGGKIVITDGFFTTKDKVDFLGKYFSRKVCQLFEVKEWADKNLFFQEMDRVGFANQKSEDLSWKIGPSVLQAFFFKFPLSVVRYFKGEAEGFQVRYFFLAGIFAPLLGLHHCFEYRIVTAQKD